MAEQHLEKKQPWKTIEPTGPLLRPNSVFERIPLSRSQVYAMIAEGKFPPFLKLSDRASAMPEAWLNSYIEMQARRAFDRSE